MKSVDDVRERHGFEVHLDGKDDAQDRKTTSAYPHWSGKRVFNG